MPISLNFSRFTELPKLFRKLGFKNGAEIGVSTGRYSKALCQRIPNLNLSCIDPWLAYYDYIEHHDAKGQVILDSNLEKAKERLAAYDCKFIRAYSMDAVKDFKDESLDFVFIDGNHSFEYVINDIAEWSKKVRIGGIISGHDYWNSIDTKPWAEVVNSYERMRLCQVKDAVDGWTKAHLIKPWFIMTNDKCPSWFWVKGG
jgi:hypothetical protein